MPKSALVVIDVQKYFITKHTKNLPRKIADYIEENRKKFDYILFTKFVNKKNSNFFKLLSWKACTKAPDTNIHPDIAGLPDMTFDKSGFSAFSSKKFERFLKSNKIRRLFICGTDTECCIYATAMDAFDRGFDIRVIEDLCGSSHGKAAHKIGVELLKKNLWSCNLWSCII